MVSADDDGLAELGEQEYEVEDIIRYRKMAAGEEFFLIKWKGFPASESTWEPLSHMKSTCNELVTKARLLFMSSRGQVRRKLPDAPEKTPERTPEEIVDALLFDGKGIEEVQVSDGIGEDPLAKKRRTTSDGDPAAKILAAESKVGARQKPKPSSIPPPSPPASPPPASLTATRLAKNARVERDLKCICGALGRVTTSGSDGMHVVCLHCGCALHAACVTTALCAKKAPEEYACPMCRIEHVDEFHLPVGPQILRFAYTSANATISLPFQSQVAHWRKQQWNVHLRAVSLNQGTLGGPTWPHRVVAKLNGRQCVNIEPPKHLHVRREQCYNLTPLVRQGLNSLELRLSPNPERPRDQPEEDFCIAAVLTKPRTVAAMVASIRGASKETVETGKQRVGKILASTASAAKKTEDECIVSGDFGRKMKPVCPVSFCPIEDAVVGRNCAHVQVFDLQSYITVNQKMPSLDKRWTCPICSKELRPNDVVIDPFAQEILDSLKGEEENIDSVLFNDDLSWATISVEKDKPDDDEAPEGLRRNDSKMMIDLSDSE